MEAILKNQAEKLARQMTGQATTLEHLNDLMPSIRKTALERMLPTERDVHLGRREIPKAGEAAGAAAQPPATDKQGQPARHNRRNGPSRKTVRGERGEVTLKTPRARDGPFEPKLIGKHQRRLAGFDEKILALYAKGMTIRDLQEIVKELYGVEVSPTLVSEITADLDREVTEWRVRRLDVVYPIV